MSKEIIYRKIKKKDFDAIKEIINQSFNLSVYVVDKKILKCFLSEYLYSCLAEATFTCVAEEDGKIIGVINGNAKKDYNFFKHIIYNVKNLWYSNKMKYISKKNNIKSKEQGLMAKTYATFLKNAKHNYDGVLTLFAVLSESRGKGVGTELFNRLMAYYLEKKLKWVYLFTDSCCNCSFYEKKGFTRLQTEKLLLTREKKAFEMEVYFYEKEIDVI